MTCSSLTGCRSGATFPFLIVMEPLRLGLVYYAAYLLGSRQTYGGVAEIEALEACGRRGGSRVSIDDDLGFCVLDLDGGFTALKSHRHFNGRYHEIDLRIGHKLNGWMRVLPILLPLGLGLGLGLGFGFG